MAILQNVKYLNRGWPWSLFPLREPFSIEIIKWMQKPAGCSMKWLRQILKYIIIVPFANSLHQQMHLQAYGCTVIQTIWQIILRSCVCVWACLLNFSSAKSVVCWLVLVHFVFLSACFGFGFFFIRPKFLFVAPMN